MENNDLVDLLRNFEKQFNYKPKIENLNNFKYSSNLFVAGMGGSHLAAHLINDVYPKINITIHSNYGLPPNIDTSSLLIVSSFSGETEETIDAFNCAFKKKIPTIVISSGGKLIELSKKRNTPFIQIPKIDLPPRLAIGYSLLAFSKILNKKIKIRVDNQKIEKEGKELAEKIYNTIPIIYSSEKNKSISKFWKINFNEGSKNLSFFNVFPELNHNEIVSFSKNKKDFNFILIEDENDHPRIKLRMNIFKKIFSDYKIEIIKSKEKDAWSRAIYFILLSSWTSYYLALKNKVEFEKIEIINKFKKELS